MRLADRDDRAILRRQRPPCRTCVQLRTSPSRAGYGGEADRAPVPGCSACSGRKRWEDEPPHVAATLRQLAAAHAQQAPTFRTPLASRRLIATGTLEALTAHGHADDHLPSPATTAAVLTRRGVRPRTVIKAKPPKKRRETDASFDKRKKRGSAVVSGNVQRVRLDGKATVRSDAVARGWLTLGDDTAWEHDLGGTETYMPCGIVAEERGERHITCGSSDTTNAVLVDTLKARWQAMEASATTAVEVIADPNG